MRGWIPASIAISIAGLVIIGCGDDGATTNSGTSPDTTGTTTSDSTTTAGPTTTTTTTTDPSGTDSESIGTTEGITTGPNCVDPEIECDGDCVDPGLDPNNCGGCGVACGDGEVCNGGVCETECEAPTPDECDRMCTDLQTDPGNCGACGTACADGEECTAGACVSVCADMELYCDGACTDPQVDPNNCGDCGVVCADGEQCTDGMCESICADMELYCDGMCTDPQVDPNNCGDCGVVCAVDEVCMDGACAPACAMGELFCDGQCTDPNVDPNNCGDCGVVCANGDVCIQGTCAMPKVLVIGSAGVVTQLQQDGFDVTSATWQNALPLIDIAQFQVILMGRYAFTWPSMTDPIKDAINTYNLAGGHIITEWDGLSIFFSGYTNNYRYPNGAQSMNWFAGDVASGYSLGVNIPVTQTVPMDPLFNNVNNPFMADGATNFFFYVDNYDVNELELLGTFEGNNTINFPAGTHATILRGLRCGGNILFASFDYQDDADNAGFGDLMQNLVLNVLGPPSGNVTDVCP